MTAERKVPGTDSGVSSAACVADALGGALANSDDLLRRLSEWDAMNVAPYAGDRDYWLGEIDNARTLNRIALQQAKEAVMKSDAAAISGWYAPGVEPTPGERYEFEDFVGARFTATLASFLAVSMEDADGRSCVGLCLTFDDREMYETNLPVRFRDV